MMGHALADHRGPGHLPRHRGQLFTDQANPTSNTLYQRLGYQPVCGWAVLVFGEPD
jgi:hypothetical protein